MRVVKFRGKSSNNVEFPISDEIIVEKGQWIYGSLVNDAAPNEDGSTCLIHTKTEYGLQYFYVDPATIGQFTGLLDADGKEIYEGDILRHNNFKGVVCWNSKGNFYLNDNKHLEEKDCENLGNILEYEDFVVVGNIHDNPELLEERQ